MASESSGFAMARERLTHDMLSKPISARPRISSAFDNAGGAEPFSPITVTSLRHLERASSARYSS